MDKIEFICLSKLHALISGMQNNENIIVYDNVEKPDDLIGVLSSPMKFDFNLSLFLLEGSITIRIGHEEFTLKPHDWATVITGKIFQFVNVSDDAKFKVRCINEGFYNMNPETVRITDVFDRLMKNPVISLSEESTIEYLDYFKHFKKYASNKHHKCRTELLKCFCNAIFLILYSEIQQEDCMQKRLHCRKETIYQDFLLNVKKYYLTERSVKFYANKLCLTPKYLSDVVHQVTGQHASEWINSHTLLEIKALLKNTNVPIQQIAYKLNFSNPAHFGKFFKRLTGLSPKEFRHAI